MPRLLYVLRDFPVLSETFVQREIEALTRRGMDLRVWSIRAAGIVAAAGSEKSGESNAGVRLSPRILWPFARDPRRLLFLLRQWASLRGLVHEARWAGHVHAHFAGPVSDLAGLAARCAGREWSCSVHAWDVFAARPRTLASRLRPAVAVMACTQAGVDALVRAGIASSKIILARHGLPLAEYPMRLPTRGGGAFCAVGRLVPKKGFDTLLDAVARLRSDGGPGAGNPLVLVGDGPQRKILQRRAQRLGLGDVVFAGALDPAAVRAQVRDAVLLALPSRRMPDGDRDGMANVLLEAMALGVPVVTTTAGAAGELFRDPEHLWMVPPNDAVALARAFLDVVANPGPTAAHVQCARRQVEQHFNLEHAILPLEAFFRAAARPVEDRDPNCAKGDHPLVGRSSGPSFPT